MSKGWIITQLCRKRGPFHGIYSLATDDNGYIYYTSENRIWKVQLISNNKGSSFVGMVCDRNVLYLCDHHRKCHKIVKYSLDTGILSTVVGEVFSRRAKDGNFKRAAICYPLGITVDKNGDIFFTESSCVRKVSLSQQTVTTVATTYQDRLQAHGIAVSEDGSIYIADTYKNCILKIKDGVVSPFSSSRDGFAMTVAVLANGNVVFGVRNGLKLMNNNQHVVSTLNLVSSCGIDGICECSNGDLIVAISGYLYKLERTWKYERYLWIGC